MSYYPNYCKTDIQKAVYDELLRLSDEHNSIAFHDLEPFERASGYSRTQIIEVITLFDSKGLFGFAQHAG